MRDASRNTCLSGAIALGLLLSSCSDPAAEADSDPGEPGSIRGFLLSATADYHDEGRSEKLYALQRKDGSLLSLQFSGRPEAVPGSEILVWGTARVDGLHVERLKLVKPFETSGIGTQRSALIDPPILMPPLKAALVSVTPTLTKEMLEARMMQADFIKQVLDVTSYGRWTMEWDAYAGLTIPNDCGGTFYSNVGTNGVAAMKAAGINADQYQQIQFILGNSVPACSWGGFGWDGKTPIRTDGLRGMYNPWSYVKGTSEGVMVQEIGHNWGLAHEHFCPGTQTPTSNPNCPMYDEYGSPFTPMASGNNVYLNAWERIQMNFLGGCNVLTVGTSGTYELAPITISCNGPQVLRIKAGPSPAGDFNYYYYLEYRTPLGIERTNGVLVHYSADIKKGGWSRCDWGGPDCPEDYLINPKGGAKGDSVLTEGYEWMTPQGVGIKIVSLGKTAKFEVTFATPGDAPTCLEGDPWDNRAPVCKGDPGAPDGGGGGAGGGTSDAGTGTGGSGGATGGTGGATTGTGGATTGTGGTTGDDKGCSCRMTGSGTPGRLSALAASAALAMAARWRRRARKVTRS